MATDALSAAKMNGALESMRSRPDTVCQLFAAMTSAGVVPDLESYKLVVDACVSQGLPEHGQSLYEAAALQGLTGLEELAALLPAVKQAVMQSPERKPAALLQTPVKAGLQAQTPTTIATDGSPSVGSPDLAQRADGDEAQAAQDALSALMSQPQGTVNPEVLSAAYLRVVSLRPQQQDPLLAQAVSAGRLDKAWQLVGQALRTHRPVDQLQLALLLKACGKDPKLRGQTKRHLDLVEEYAASLPCDEMLLHALLEASGRVQDLPRLERVLERMQAKGFEPTPGAFGTLLKAYGAKGDTASVLRVWADMKRAKVTVNSITAGCMLDACVKCGQFQVVEDVFQELRNLGLHKNTILFTTLIKGYCRQKKLSLALKAKADMREEGVNLNVVTYNSLVDVAIRCKDLQCATDLVTEMQEANIQPDLITYSTLVKGFCDQGDLAVAMDLLSHLRAVGIKPDEIFYNSLLEGCVKATAMPPAAALRTGLEVFGEMLSEKCTPSNITFSILVKLYARADGLDQAMRLVQTMEQTFRVRPTNVVFATLVKCCVLGGRAHAAGTLLLGLPLATKLQPDQSMYAPVLPVLLASDSCKDLELAAELLLAAAKAPCKDASPLAVRGFTEQLVHKASLMSPYTPGFNAMRAHLERCATAFGVHVPQTAWDQVATKEFVPGQQWAEEPWYPSWPQHDEWGCWTDQWAYTGAETAEAAAETEQTEDADAPKSPEPTKPRDENASPNVLQMLLAKSPAKGSPEQVPKLPLSNLN